ncbi:hypothetical protein [Herbidospora yilanensis]|uniref:hypothetical protein n=1 Tax=Herbidospora yilanensis TaxID=354426 RepID=UPI000A575D1E|nr:hypothetical protein [Herbidospora yilanensis]
MPLNTADNRLRLALGVVLSRPGRTRLLALAGKVLPETVKARMTRTMIRPGRD